jgi:hypothetical protein
MPTNWNRDYQSNYKDVSVSRVVVAGVDGDSDPLIAGKAGHVIVVRRIAIIVTTTNAATWTVQTSNGTPVVLAFVGDTTTTGAGMREFVFSQEGSEGYILPAGEDVDLAMSAAGPAGIVHVEAHMRLAANTPITADAFKA